MFSRSTLLVWIGIVILSGMFLLGQDGWGGACVDVDDDGYYAIDPANCPQGDDCGDLDPSIYPGAIEGPLDNPTCDDEKDNDCDGLIDTADPDCQPLLEGVANEAAFAATRQLGILYEAMSYESQQAYVCDPAEIILVAQNVAQDYEWVEIDPGDVRIGKWDENTSLLVQTLNQPNSVKVVARRISDGITAEATAALTGQGTSGPGDLELPLGVSSFFFDGHGCNDWITFTPTNDPDSCGGWTTWDHNANDITLRRILEEVPGYESPGMVAGEDTSSFVGGDISTYTFDAMVNLFRRKGYDYDPATGLPIQVNGDGVPIPGHLGEEGVPLYADDGVTRLLYPDGTPRNYHRWEALVVVYEWHDCSNPNTDIMIAGFSTIVLSDVLGPPDKLLRGQILCNNVVHGQSGGPDFGTKGSIPILVQ